MKWIKGLAIALVLGAILYLIYNETTVMKISHLTLTSPAFLHGGSIPSKYTCDGENVSPPLQIAGVAEGARALALIMEDPDVPKSIRADGMWDHWLIWNIPPDTTSIEEGKEPQGVPGTGTGGEQGYQGPCPPDREHRYVFKLFSLDAPLSLHAAGSKAELEEAMQGHILQTVELVGKYKRK